MALERGRSLNRGSRNTLVESSFGVVKSNASSFGEVISGAGEQLEKLTQFQIEVMDENWKSDFKTKTNQFYSEINEKYINNEQPDLQKLQTEILSYKQSLLNNAPKRFSNYINSYIDQESLSTFEFVKNHANKLQYKSTFDSLNSDIEQIGGKLLKNLNNIGDERSFEDTMTLINFYTGFVTNDLTDFDKKMQILQKIDPLKFGEAEKETMLNQMFMDIEKIRSSFVVDAFYKDVDFKNPKSKLEADNKFMEYLDRYGKGEEWKPTTNLSSKNIMDLQSSMIKRKDDILKVKANELAIAKEKQDLENKRFVNSFIEQTKNLNNVSNETRGILTNNAGELMKADEILDYFYDSYGIVLSDTEAQELSDNQFHKVQINSLVNDLSMSNEPLKNILYRPEYAESVEYYGGVSKVMDTIIAKQFEGISPEMLNNADANNIQGVLDLTIKHGVVSDNVAQWFNQYDFNYLENLTNIKDAEDKANRVALFDKAYQSWKYLTADGSIPLDGIDTQTKNLMTVALAKQDLKLPSQQFIESILRDKKLNTEHKQNVASGKADYYFENVEQFYGSNEIDIFEEELANPFFPFVKSDKILKLMLQDELSSYAANKGAFIGSEKEKQITKNIIESYKINEDYLNTHRNEINQLIKDKVNEEATGFESPDRLMKMHEAFAVETVREYMMKNDVGPSSFAPNGFGEYSVTKNSMEKNHGLDELSAKSMVFAHVLQLDSYIKNDPNLSLEFKDLFRRNGEYVEPTQQDYYQMIDDGAIELHYIGGSGVNAEYQVKFNLSATDLFDDNDYVGQGFNVTLDGQYFNPSKLYDLSFQQVQNRVINETINDSEFVQMLEDTGIQDVVNVKGMMNKVYTFFNNTGIMDFESELDGKEFVSPIKEKEEEGVPVISGAAKLAKGIWIRIFDREPSAIEQRFVETMIDRYENVKNDASTQFVNLYNNKQNTDEAFKNPVNAAKELHLKIYPGDTTVPDYSNNIELLNDEVFTSYNNFEKGLILDVVSTYDIDIEKFKNGVSSGSVDLLKEALVNVNDYHRKILVNTFSVKKF